MASHSVSKTEGEGSNPSTPATTKQFKVVKRHSPNTDRKWAVNCSLCHFYCYYLPACRRCKKVIPITLINKRDFLNKMLKI